MAKIAFELEEFVYLKHDPSQFKRMVTGVLVKSGSILYMLACAGEETFHNENEITRKSDIMITSTN